MKDYKNRLFIDSGIHFGKPCVVGTRIPVENVLELVHEGLPFIKIIEDYYPDLAVEDIKACIEYALDLVHSEDIRADIR